MLSGGKAQMLAIARGLMAKLELLLDERRWVWRRSSSPTLWRRSRASRVRGRPCDRAARGAERAPGVTELQIATRAYVLENGRVALHGLVRELLANDEMRRAYLGSTPGRAGRERLVPLPE
jgi:branched-chain amino acid transport system ATP-binding protein